jgi:WD40 repeat protein
MSPHNDGPSSEPVPLPLTRDRRPRALLRILGVAFLGIAVGVVCLFELSGLAQELVKSTLVEPTRKEGDWAVTKLGKLRFSWHLDKEHRLLVGCEGKPPELWDTEAGTRVAVLGKHQGELATAARSPDGSRFVTAGEIGYFHSMEKEKVVRSLWVWETASGKLIKRIDVDLSAKGVRDSSDWKISWQGEAELLLQLHSRSNPARASGQTVFGAVDVDKGRVTRLSDPLKISEHLIASPDGKRALATRQYGFYRDVDGGIGRGGRGQTSTVTLVDVEGFQVLGTLDDGKWGAGKEPRTIGEAIWSPDGRLVATVRSDHTVGIWDVRDCKLVCELKGHTDWILSARFSPDGDRVLTASDDETARVWDAKTGKQLVLLAGHTSGRTDAAFDDLGKQVLTGGEDQTARLWDAGTGKQVRVWADHDSGVRHVTFDPRADRVHTRTARGIERTWSVDDGSLLSKGDPPKAWRFGSPVQYGVCFLKQSDTLTEVWVGPPGATPPSEEPPANLRVLTTGPLLESEDPSLSGLATPALMLKGHKAWLSEVALAPDGKSLATRAEWNRVLVWRPAEWDRVTGRGRTVLAVGQKAGRLAFSPDGGTLATGHDDGVVRLWDPVGGRLRKDRHLYGGPVRYLAYLPDGKTLISVGTDSNRKSFEVKRWESGGDKERTLAQGESPGLSMAAVDRNGRMLAVVHATYDNRDSRPPDGIALWDLESGKEVGRLSGHDGWIEVLAFSPDGKTLIAAGQDKVVHLWDVATGKEQATLWGPGEIISALAISPAGRLLASGDWNGHIKLWDLATGKERTSFKAYRTMGRVTVLVCSHDGKTLVSGSGDGSAKLWDLATLLRPPDEK